MTAPLPPSFSSFPVFDSFPAASSSRQTLRSESSEDDVHKASRHEHGSKRSRGDGEHERRRRRHDNDAASEVKKREKGKERERDRDRDRDRDVDDRAHKKRAERSRSRERSRAADDNTDKKRRHRHRSTSREPVKEPAPDRQRQYYNVPDLVSGEIAVLSRKSDSGKPTGTSADTPDYKLFSIDRRGDQDVRRYGKPYKGSIPNYRRSGYGHVLGLEGEFKITKDSAYAGQGLDVVAGRAPSNAPRLGDKRNQLLITDRNFRRITLSSLKSDASASAVPLSAEADYVPLLREVTARERIGALEHEDGQDYRSVAGLIKPSDVEKGDSATEEGDELEEEGGESTAEYVQRWQREFEQHLRAHPNDVQQWLALTAFQGEVAGSLASSSADMTRSSRKRVQPASEKRSLCEVKLSILERALAQPGNEGSPALSLALMDAGSPLWDTKECMRRWMALLRERPEDVRYWNTYITFRQTSAGAFDVKEVVEVYADCLDRLGTAARKSAPGSRARRAVEDNCLYLLLRLCLLLQQADYTERALAALQAMMELNFHLPDQHTHKAHVDRPGFDAALDELESFWDSEAPRFGEEGAVGWRNTTDDAVPPAPVGLSADSRAGTSGQHLDPFVRWGLDEQASSRRRIRPSRTTDESDEAEDDPYSTVLFSDIRGLLFVVTSQDARSQLIYSFLFFLGLPLTPPDTSTSTSLSSDTFLHSHSLASPAKRRAFWPATSTDSFLRALVPFDTIAGEPMQPVRTAALQDPFDTPFRKFPMSPDLLYQTSPKWFSLLDQKEYLQELDLPLIRNVLAQCRTVSKDIFLTLAYFSIEASLNPKSAVKVAKGILKNDSKNLLLWDAFARIEKSYGNLKAARSVYANALQLSQHFPEKERMDAPLLWRAWAEMEWEAGRENVALTVLVASSSAQQAEGALDAIVRADTLDKPSPAMLLRARQHYVKQLTLANSDDAPQALFRHRISLLFSLALLEYLSTGLEACSSVFNRQVLQIRQEGKQSAEEEEAIALHAKLLFRHTQTRTAFRPAALRDLLEGALRDFPNNSIFLSLHLFNELRTRIEGRVRRVMDELVLKPESVTSEGWHFAIFAEMHLSARGYNVEAVRSLFERAVDNDRTQSSISIWSLYIEFELRHNQIKRAKGLLQRALVQCPWAKSLYMLAFGSTFRQAYRSRDLQEIHRLMLEKGIRLHMRLDTYIADYRSEVSDDDEEGLEAETADALHAQTQAAERLRLMPL